MTEGRYGDGRYLEAHPSWHAEDSARKAGYVLTMMEKHRLAPARICDIGCGAGEILRQLSLRLPATTALHGYDISADAIAMAREKVGDNLKFFNEDIAGRRDGAYDLALAIDTFEHVPDCLAFLEMVRGKGRHTIFHIPLDLNVPNLFGDRLLKKRRLYGHLHYFTPRLALEALGDTGHEVVDSFYTAVAADAPSTGLSRALALPRRALASLSGEAASTLLGGFSLMVLTR